MTYILGINAYHAGASACLIHDGMLVAAAEEERFSRIKYNAGFPVAAIRYVLEEAGIGPEALDHIGISRDPRAHVLKKIMFTVANHPSPTLIRDRLLNASKVGSLKDVFCRQLEIAPTRMRAAFHNVEHHRAHMASTFFVSPFEQAAVLSIDGMGDFVSTMWGSGRGNHLDVAGYVPSPHSLGHVYTAVSQWLGFEKYGDEGKVMGLAPYGQPNYFDQLSNIVRIQRDGTFELDLDYFDLFGSHSIMTWESAEPVLARMYSSKFVDTFGEPRLPRSEITQRHMDMAASLQSVLETTEFALLKSIQRSTGASALCLAGGVALNSAFNGKVLSETEFTDIFIQPASGDAGTALGVCYYIHHQILNLPRGYQMTDPYTGPGYDEAEILDALTAHGLRPSAIAENMLVELTAERLANGDVVGWFQGRMEWGPRALGNRSILADPRRNDMKEILNSRIKHREWFRPFAPAVLMEDVDDYFEQSYPDPFMLKVYGIRPERRCQIPAVTHVDGTGRLQTVDRKTNERFWNLIRAFDRLTGVPVLLNTSFNENEPIVCSPSEAIECFLRTRMDALVLGNYLVEKRSA